MDLITKLLGTITPLKGAYEWFFYRSQGRLRDEYRFAKEFMIDLHNTPDMHPFLKEKGYQAIAGDINLSSSEIEYLITLENSPQAIKDYSFGKRYLQYYVAAKRAHIGFRFKYQSHRSRFWRKVFYLVLFVLFSGCALSPVLLSSFESKEPELISQSIVLLVTSLIFFAPVAFLANYEIARIARAEVLVENQRNKFHQQT